MTETPKDHENIGQLLYESQAAFKVVEKLHLDEVETLRAALLDVLGSVGLRRRPGTDPAWLLETIQGDLERFAQTPAGEFLHEQVDRIRAEHARRDAAGEGSP